MKKEPKKQTCYWLEGKTKSHEYFLLDGMFHGIYSWFHPDGSIDDLRTFKEDERCGVNILFVY